MKYVLIMVVSIFLFTGLGWGIGYFASESIEIRDEDVRLAVLLSPIGIGAGVGLLVGVVSSILTAVNDRRRE